MAMPYRSIARSRYDDLPGPQEAQVFGIALQEARYADHRSASLVNSRRAFVIRNARSSMRSRIPPSSASRTMMIACSSSLDRRADAGVDRAAEAPRELAITNNADSRAVAPNRCRLLGRCAWRRSRESGRTG
jgi:hypothetical protein